MKHDTVGAVLRGEAGEKKRVCPECKSGKVHRSQMRGVVERGILRPLGIRAYRCSQCDERFFRFGTDAEGKLAQGQKDTEPVGIGSRR